MYKVIFKHPEQAYIYPKLLAAVNQACNDYGKDAECVAGYRSLECQKATNAGCQLLEKVVINQQMVLYTQAQEQIESVGLLLTVNQITAFALQWI